MLQGLALNILASIFVSNWFNSFVDQTVKESFNVVNTINISNFSNFDFQSIGIYSAILIFITITISFIPAIRASSISPVEAIKGE